MEIKIIATTGRAQGQAIDLKAAKLFIGAHENCQVRPDIAGLAGIHALIEQREGRVYLRDFGAQGGTGLNDRVLVARESEIFEGDLIQVGPMVLTMTLVANGDTTIASRPQVPLGWPFLQGAPIDEPTPVETMLPTARRSPLVAAQPPFAAENAPLPGQPMVLGRSYAQAARRVDPIDSLLPGTPEPAATLAARSAAALAATAVIVEAANKPALDDILKPVVYKALRCDLVEGVVVATVLPAALDDEASVSPFRYELRTIIENDPPGRMVIDLGATHYLSSRAVGVILAHYQAMGREGGTLRVCRVNPDVEPVLRQMRLSLLIDVYPTLVEALADSWD